MAQACLTGLRVGMRWNVRQDEEADLCGRIRSDDSAWTRQHLELSMGVLLRSLKDISWQEIQSIPRCDERCFGKAYPQLHMQANKRSYDVCLVEIAKVEQWLLSASH